MDLIHFLLCLIQIIALVMSKKKVEESNTGALVTFPYTFDGALYNKTWEVAPAQFGYQKYGGKLTGWLILPMNNTFHLECDGGEPQYTGTGDAQEIANPYIHYIKDMFAEDDDIHDFIMVIDRLDCYFVDKVEVAQRIGASGVIVCDKLQEHLFTMWMPGDWDDDITIPSVLMSESNCETMYSHMGLSSWDPYDIASIVYPSVYEMTWTVAEIEWGLPHDDDRVEWELWTSSNDEEGTEFKHHFENISKALDADNYTVFTPHMYILNGSHWGCDDATTLPCKTQCTNNGRYCAVDPEKDMTLGLDGLDVIQENLRSLCVWEYDKKHFAENDDIMWWDYVVAWDERCGILSDGVSNFNEACAYEQMDRIKVNGKLSEFVRTCIEDSGGYNYTGGVNTILRRETRLRENSSIYALPMVRVNEFMVHGNIDCPPPITVSTCTVLQAICAGFLNGTKPAICDVTPAPIMCTDEVSDCAGECYGSHVTDKCGQCYMVNDDEYDSCVGCDSVAYSGKELNPCGLCIMSDTKDFDTYGMDCAGNCASGNSNKAYYIDDCGQCLLTTDSRWNSCDRNNNTTPGLTVESLRNKENELTTVIVVVCVLAFLIIIGACIIIAKLWKKQGDITQRFNSLAATYVSMDENPAHTIQNNKGALTIPDRDSGEDDD